MGAVVLAALVLAQTMTHLDVRSAYLYMTLPGFPVGAGTGADGYMYWLETHPTYQESWQFARQAAIYDGAETELTTGDHDARAAYSYLGALLAGPLGYFGAFVTLNVLFWLVASLATWYLAAALLGNGPAAYAAALLTATGQGFVFMAGTPMSYVAGYAWGAVLLALAARWRLFGWQSRATRWLIWGWLCGVAGLFYFTHIVLVGTAWVFGLRRVPIGHLVLYTAVALAIPGTWFLFGHYAIGLQFRETTAQDLAGSVRRLADIATHTPLLLPDAAGEHSVRALVGGYYYAVLALAAAGMVAAPPRRRAWYLAVALCGLGPAFVLHMIPVTQRYGYLAYPAIHVAAAEGAWRLGRECQRWLAAFATRVPVTLLRGAYSPASVGCWAYGALALVVVIQLVQANADLWRVYHFSLAFGAP
jgi:hypothetical protein